MLKVLGLLGFIVCCLITFVFLLVAFMTFTQSFNLRSVFKNIRVIPDGKVLPENEGELVLVSGRIRSGGGTVSDPAFGLTVDSPYLERIVEVYQQSKGENSVFWAWSRNKIADAFYSSAVKIGEFEFPSGHLNKLKSSMVRVTELKQSQAGKYYKVAMYNNYYYYLPVDDESFIRAAGNLDNIDFSLKETVGDTRVSFKMLDLSNPAEYTVLAKQEGAGFAEYKGGHYPLYEFYEGRKSLSEVLVFLEMYDREDKIYTVVCTAFFVGLTVLLSCRRISRSRSRGKKQPEYSNKDYDN